MDHYLATIQTILDRRENDNTSPSINDMEIIKINLCRIMMSRVTYMRYWIMAPMMSYIIAI